MATPTQPRPTLDISTLIERPTINIKKDEADPGQKYELYNPSELSVFDSRRLRANWDRMGAIEKRLESIDPDTADPDVLKAIDADEAEYMKAARAYISLIVVDLPSDVAQTITAPNASAIIKHFYGLPQTAPMTAAKTAAKARKNPTGAKSARH